MDYKATIEEMNKLISKYGIENIIIYNIEFNYNDKSVDNMCEDSTEFSITLKHTSDVTLVIWEKINLKHNHKYSSISINNVIVLDDCGEHCFGKRSDEMSEYADLLSLTTDNLDLFIRDLNELIRDEVEINELDRAEEARRYTELMDTIS